MINYTGSYINTGLRCWVLHLRESFHGLSLRLVKFLGYYNFDCDEVVTLLVMVGRELLHTVVSDLPLIVILYAWINIHLDISVKCFHV